MNNLSWNESLRLCREQHNYSQRELSDLIGISERTLQRYESGESEPTVSILLKLSKLYDVSIDFILGNQVEIDMDTIEIQNNLRQIRNHINIIENIVHNREEENSI